MRLNVYTIFDTASGAYMRPFYMQADNAAIRSFKDLAVAADHEIGKHPEDYSLWRIGTFDDNKGMLVPEDRECLATALELVATAQRVDKDNMERFNGTVEDEKGNSERIQ